MLFLGHIIKAVALQFREKNSQIQPQFHPNLKPTHVSCRSWTGLNILFDNSQGCSGYTWRKLEVREKAPNRRMYLPWKYGIFRASFLILTGPFNQNDPDHSKHSKTEVATKYVPHFSSIYGPFKKRPRFEGHLRRCIKICSYVNL